MEIRKKERERDSAVVDIKTLQKRRLFLGGPIWKELYTMYTLWCSSMVVLFSAFFFDYKEFLANEGTVGGLFYCQQFISSAASLFVRHQTFNGTFPQLEIYWGQQKKVALREPKFRGANVELLGRQFSNQAIPNYIPSISQWIFFFKPKKVPTSFW